MVRATASFLRGEDSLIGAWVVPHPARACSEAGQPIDLPEPTGRRDGSGTPVAVPIAIVVAGGFSLVPLFTVFGVIS